MITLRLSPSTPPDLAEEMDRLTERATEAFCENTRLRGEVNRLRREVERLRRKVEGKKGEQCSL